MDTASLKDLRATHNLLNLLYSQFQGWYVHQRILVQLNHPSATPDILAHGGKLLDVVAGWRTEFHRTGHPLICADGRTGETGIESEIGNMLRILHEKLLELGGATQSLLGKEVPLQERRDDAAYLISAVGWQAYAEQHERKTDIEFAKHFSDRELLNMREAEGATSNERISAVGQVITYLRNGESDATLFDLIISLAASLPNGEIARAALSVQRYLPFFVSEDGSRQQRNQEK